MDKFPFKMGVILAWSFPIQDEPYFLLYSLVKNMAHPEYSIGPPFKQALQSKVEMGFHIKWAFK